MRPPGFWRMGGGLVLPRLLAPFEAVTAAATARRVARPGWRAPVPVICCGNVTMGGAGKTLVALDLARRLTERGKVVHVLLRGYGGAARETHLVSASDGAALVGDEALLHAAGAPTWIGADRAASAREAIAAGAEVLLMDDGLQNPTLLTDLSLLVIDGGSGFGNARLFPAGPLREPVATGAARCQAAVLIGEDRTGAQARLPPGLPVVRARLEPDSETVVLAGRRVVAFAGIGVPEKFFATLTDAGAEVVRRMSFPDHHRYRGRNLRRVLDAAQRFRAIPVTTPKDAVRLPAAMRVFVHVAGVNLVWEEPADIEALLARVV
jgi:tetraacyldisaccharide 4'-kinase